MNNQATKNTRTPKEHWAIKKERDYNEENFKFVQNDAGKESLNFSLTVMKFNQWIVKKKRVTIDV